MSLGEVGVLGSVCHQEVWGAGGVTRGAWGCWGPCVTRALGYRGFGDLGMSLWDLGVLGSV